MMILSLPMLAGCLGEKKNDRTQGEVLEEGSSEETEEADGEGTNGQAYILLHHNEETKCVFLQDVESGRQEEFAYNGGTYIHGRYGESLTMDQLCVGELVLLTYTDKKVLTEMKVSTDAFIYEEVTGFSVDQENAIFSVGSSNYYYDDDLKIFSEEGIISLNELSSQDTICMRGFEKKILTVVVTRGHGTVALKNTALFEGGMVTIGNVTAQKVNGDMTLEVPEGTYTLSVANDGYGGSKEITVKRFEELTVDLDVLKGDGPQFCKLKINVTPQEAKVTIDGGAADCSQILELRFGTYQIKAEAEGYTSWSGKLVVSSAEAAVTIELDKDPNAEETSSEKTDDNEADAEKAEDEKKEN